MCLTGTRHHGIIQSYPKYIRICEESNFSGFCAPRAGRGAGKGGAKGQGEAAARGHDNDAKESLDETQCKEHLMTQQLRVLDATQCKEHQNLILTTMLSL